MKTVARVIIGLLFAGFVSNVSAVPIGAADRVTIGGQEWAQVNLFTNTTWNMINAQCPGGPCSSAAVINGWELDGWTWASSEEVQTLFNAFTGQETVPPGEYYEEDSAWGPLFLGLFNPTRVDPRLMAVNGWSSSAQGDKAFLAFLGISDRIIPDGAGTSVVFDKDVQRPTIGGWFLRETIQVSSPATISMLGLALANLGLFRRKNAVKV